MTGTRRTRVALGYSFLFSEFYFPRYEKKKLVSEKLATFIILYWEDVFQQFFKMFLAVPKYIITFSELAFLEDHFWV